MRNAHRSIVDFNPRETNPQGNANRDVLSTEQIRHDAFRSISTGVVVSLLEFLFNHSLPIFDADDERQLFRSIRVDGSSPDLRLLPQSTQLTFQYLMNQWGSFILPHFHWLTTVTMTRHSRQKKGFFCTAPNVFNRGEESKRVVLGEKEWKVSVDVWVESFNVDC